MHSVCTRFCNDVDNSTCRAPIFGAGTCRNHLKFLDCFKCDVNGRTLSAGLFPKKSIVVIAAIEADIVENSALARKIDFVTVWPLRNAYARC